MQSKEGYNILTEANEIANKGFAGDYVFTIAYLEYFRNKAEKCGCPQCKAEYERKLQEKWDEWKRPVEDDDEVKYKIQVYAPRKGKDE